MNDTERKPEGERGGRRSTEFTLNAGHRGKDFTGSLIALHENKKLQALFVHGYRNLLTEFVIEDPQASEESKYMTFQESLEPLRLPPPFIEKLFAQTPFELDPGKRIEDQVEEAKLLYLARRETAYIISQELRQPLTGLIAAEYYLEEEIRNIEIAEGYSRTFEGEDDAPASAFDKQRSGGLDTFEEAVRSVIRARINYGFIATVGMFIQQPVGPDTKENILARALKSEDVKEEDWNRYSFVPGGYWRLVDEVNTLQRLHAYNTLLVMRKILTYESFRLERKQEAIGFVERLIPYFALPDDE